MQHFQHIALIVKITHFLGVAPFHLVYRYYTDVLEKPVVLIFNRQQVPLK